MPSRLAASCLIGVAMTLVFTCQAGAQSLSLDPELPAGIEPLREPVNLRYRDVGRFTFTFRQDMPRPDGRFGIAEGWIMEGSARPAGEGLAWSYRLSNIGHDGVAREAGSLAVTTDAWGSVVRASVLEDRWRGAQQRPPSLADGLFDAAALRFPLCCCPHGSVKAGDRVPHPPGLETMPETRRPPDSRDMGGRIVRHNAASIVVGKLAQAGHDHLVIVHKGETELATASGAVVYRLSGYSLIDMQTCLPRSSIWARTVHGPGAGEAAGRFGIVTSQRTGD